MQEEVARVMVQKSVKYPGIQLGPRKPKFLHTKIVCLENRMNAHKMRMKHSPQNISVRILLNRQNLLPLGKRNSGGKREMGHQDQLVSELVRDSVITARAGGGGGGCLSADLTSAQPAEDTPMYCAPPYPYIPEKPSPRAIRKGITYPPLGNNNFSEIGRHYPVGRVRGNLAAPPPPCQTPIYIYIYIYIPLPLNLANNNNNNNKQQARLHAVLAIAPSQRYGSSARVAILEPRWCPCQIQVLSQKLTGGGPGRWRQVGRCPPKSAVLGQKQPFFAQNSPQTWAKRPNEGKRWLQPTRGLTLPCQRAL